MQINCRINCVLLRITKQLVYLTYILNIIFLTPALLPFEFHDCSYLRPTSDHFTGIDMAKDPLSPAFLQSIVDTKVVEFGGRRIRNWMQITESNHELGLQRTKFMQQFQKNDQTTSIKIVLVLWLVIMNILYTYLRKHSHILINHLLIWSSCYAIYCVELAHCSL